jgi:hypothetical protein
VKAALLAVTLLAVGAGATRAADDRGRAEAAERFDRGMALLEQGDNAGRAGGADTRLRESRRTRRCSTTWASSTPR